MRRLGLALALGFSELVAERGRLRCNLIVLDEVRTQRGGRLGGMYGTPRPQSILSVKKGIMQRNKGVFGNIVFGVLSCYFKAAKVYFFYNPVMLGRTPWLYSNLQSHGHCPDLTPGTSATA